MEQGDLLILNNYGRHCAEQLRTHQGSHMDDGFARQMLDPNNYPVEYLGHLRVGEIYDFKWATGRPFHLHHCKYFDLYQEINQEEFASMLP